jgi:hypothetical protein
MADRVFTQNQVFEQEHEQKKTGGPVSSRRLSAFVSLRL